MKPQVGDGLIEGVGVQEQLALQHRPDRLVKSTDIGQGTQIAPMEEEAENR